MAVKAETQTSSGGRQGGTEGKLLPERAGAQSWSSLLFCTMVRKYFKRRSSVTSRCSDSVASKRRLLPPPVASAFTLGPVRSVAVALTFTRGACVWSRSMTLPARSNTRGRRRAPPQTQMQSDDVSAEIIQLPEIFSPDAQPMILSAPAGSSTWLRYGSSERSKPRT